MEYLITVDELNSLNQNHSLKIVDTRDTSVYQKSHIAESINIPEIFTYICLPENGDHRGMVEYFTNRLSEAGIKNTDDIVFYEDAMDNGYGQSCRGWFIFRLLGHKGKILVLHGGMRAWNAKQLPLSNEKTKNIPAVYEADMDSSIIVRKDEMLNAIDDPDITIVDVRDYAEWIGANSSPYGYDYCPRKGRIPGAIWLEWYRLMTRKEGIPWFRSKEEILNLCEQVGISRDKTIYVYCFKGARTSNVMLAMTMAELKVRNYFNSWNEWSRDLSLPIQEDYPDSPLSAF